jgi:glycosyltransferase involved in cell wall biosynthesis
MKIAFLSVTCNTDEKLENISDIAIGRYSKHTLLPIAERLGSNDSITVITTADSNVEFKNEKISVVKLFKKNLFIGFKLLNYFRKNKFDVIHFQHEFFIYGGILQSLLITMALFFTRTRKVITAHHIIDISGLTKQVAQNNKFPYPLFIVKLGLRVSYFFMIICTHAIIVHEKYQKDILVRNWRFLFRNLRDKVIVVHHGIATLENMPNESAKEKLGLKAKFYAIFFGYVGKHKGLDILLDAIEILQKEGEDVSVIVAGGEHPKLLSDPEYVDFYDSLKAQGDNLKNVYWHGFAHENELPLIFSAANIGVFPYTSKNATSGSVTDCISYSLPFLVSDSFSAVEEFENFVFENKPEMLAKKMKEALKNQEIYLQKALQLRDEFSWDKSAAYTLNIYNDLNQTTDEKEYSTSWGIRPE